MIPANKTVKIILGSGGVLIVVWLGILAFGAASFNSKDSGPYYPSSKQVKHSIKIIIIQREVTYMLCSPFT